MERVTRAAVAVAVLVMAALAAASPVCNVTKEQWMSESDLRTVLKRQGYLVKTVRIENGCYEVYGLDPLGRRIQNYFDPATAKPVLAPSPTSDAPA